MPVLAALDVEQGVESAVQQGLELLPKVGWFLLVLVVGVLLAKVVQKLLTRVLQKVGFDQLVERGGVKQALSRSRYDAASILGRIVYCVIVLLVLQAAFDVFGRGNGVSLFLARIVAFLALIIVPLIIAFGVGGIEPAREAIRAVQSKGRPTKTGAAADADGQPA